MGAGIRKAILFAVLSAIVAYVAFDSGSDGRAIRRDVGGEALSAPQSADPEKGAGRFAVPQRVPLGEPRAELFGLKLWQPESPKTAAATDAMALPAMPYRFAGKLLQDGQLQVFLARGDAVVAVREGDTLDGAYRIESIGETKITLLYLPLQQEQTIPVSSSLPHAGGQVREAMAVSTGTQGAMQSAANESGARSGAARLIWEGPQSVKVGTPFSVMLRVTTEEPLFGSPMQFKFDPRLLQVVAVKPGRFYEQTESKFSFRVSPEGSIFIGGANRDPAPAADAELIVLTFKPLKPAPVAELSIASLNLQGAGGRAIALGSPTAFRTAIAP